MEPVSGGLGGRRGAARKVGGLHARFGAACGAGSMTGALGVRGAGQETARLQAVRAG